MRVAILTSHPIQYYAPIFREIARRADVVVFFAHKATPDQQAAAGFGTAFEWDVDLLSGYEHQFLHNTARDPGVHHFAGCDVPQIYSKLSTGRFDALLITGWNLKCYWQGVWAAKRQGIPVLVRGDSHLDTPRAISKRLIKRLAYPQVLRLFDAALYVGVRNRAYWRHYGYPTERLFFSPHCVDTEYFSSRTNKQSANALRTRLGIGAHTSVALFAGRLVPFKRPEDLLAAAAQVRRRGIDLHVLVAGSGVLENRLREQANDANVPTRFIGFQNQSEMPAVYAASDVLVLPSDGRETWGIVANESLACGRRIIVSDAVGCAPDLASDRSVGDVYPVGEIETLANLLVASLSTTSDDHAFAAVNERYSTAAAAAGIEDALAFLMKPAARTHVS